MRQIRSLTLDGWSRASLSHESCEIDLAARERARPEQLAARMARRADVAAGLQAVLFDVQRFGVDQPIPLYAFCLVGPEFRYPVAAFSLRRHDLRDHCRGSVNLVVSAKQIALRLRHEAKIRLVDTPRG